MMMRQAMPITSYYSKAVRVPPPVSTRLMTSDGTERGQLGSRIINVDCLRQCVKEEAENHQVVLLFTGGAKHTLTGNDALAFWIENQSKEILSDDNESRAI